MNITERDRLAAALVALRPDWGGSGIDKHKGIRSWLTEHAMDWTYRDAVVRMSVCAIETSTVTPARALTDGPWSTIARLLTSDGTQTPTREGDRGQRCDTCGLAEHDHAPTRVQDGHEWTPPTDRPLASPERIRELGELRRLGKIPPQEDDHE